MRQIVRAVVILLLAIGGAAFVLVPAVLAQGQTCVRLGGSLIIPAGESCSGDAVTIGGDLVVQGAVGGDAIAIGGSVRISGQVGGDVVSLAGEVVLQGRAAINGGITVLGGPLYRGPGTVVRGSLLESGFFLPRWTIPSDVPPASLWAHVGIAVLVSLVALGVCLLLALGLRALWPQRTRVMVETLRWQPLPSLGMGVASSVLLTVLLPLAILILVVTLVGVLLVPFLCLFAALWYVVGLTIAGLALGEILVGWAKGRVLSPRVLSVLGLAILVVLTIVPAVLVPYLGPFWAVLWPSAGIGAIVLSRVGTLGRPAVGRGIA